MARSKSSFSIFVKTSWVSRWKSFSCISQESEIFEFSKEFLRNTIREAWNETKFFDDFNPSVNRVVHIFSFINLTFPIAKNETSLFFGQNVESSLRHPSDLLYPRMELKALESLASSSRRYCTWSKIIHVLCRLLRRWRDSSAGRVNDLPSAPRHENT